MKEIFFVLCISLFSAQTWAKKSDKLRKEISQIISAKNATVGVSIRSIEDNDTLNINGNLHAPLMSVFKFHIALTVLDQVDNSPLHSCSGVRF